MKRIVSLVLALSMVLSMFTFSFAGLKDVENTKYESAVEALVELGVVAGYPDGTFLPEKVVTRAELAKLLVTAYGLEAAAEVAVGPTAFGDVAADHWASGYINVAADYGFVNGYPDGTFAPDNTVSYAEAVTMCLRVLGYTNEIESKGTWPTNYMSKAQDLKMMKDIDFKSYNDGATRGNTAILIWNMLRTPMWEIRQESEGDGLVSMPYREMINVKFSDFMYLDEDCDATIQVVTIEDDGDVVITIRAKYYDAENGLVYGTSDYALKAGDLLRMIKGEQVALLVKTETDEKNVDGEVLSLTCLDKMVEGEIDENGKLNGKKYDALSGEAEGDYVVALIEGNDVKEGTDANVLPVAGAKELTANNIKKLVKEDEDCEKIYVIDGEWATVEDLKEGDVVTEVKDLGAVAGTFYVVCRERVEGTYEAYITDEDGNFAKVDGEKYELKNVKVYEYDEKDEEYDSVDEDKIADKKSKYYDEDVELVLDYLGNVVAMYFDQIDKETASSIAWYVQTGNAWTTTNKDEIVYTARLTDMGGDEDERDCNAEGTAYQGTVKLLDRLSKVTFKNASGDYEVPEEELWNLILPAFEKKGLLEFVSGDDGENRLEGFFKTDDEDAVAEYYAEMVDGEGEAIMNKDTKLIAISGENAKVGTATKVIKITPVLDEKEVVDIKVDITEGYKAMEGVKAGLVVVETVLNEDGNAVEGLNARIAYIFIVENGESTDIHYGKVTKAPYTYNKLDYIDIDGKAYEVSKNQVTGTIVKDSYVAWTENEDTINLKHQLRVADIDDECVITKIDGEFLYRNGSTSTYFIDTDNSGDDFEKTRFVLVTAEIVYDEKTEEDKISFIDCEELGKGFNSVEFEEYDRLLEASINGDNFVIIVRSDDFDKNTHMTDGIVIEYCTCATFVDADSDTNCDECGFPEWSWTR